MTNFMKDMTDFRKDMYREFKIVSEKLDYLIESKSPKDNITNRPAFFLYSKEKEPEDNKSQHNSKKTEYASSSRSSAPFYEEKEKKLLIEKRPVDSIRKRTEKKKNIIG